MVSITRGGELLTGMSARARAVRKPDNLADLFNAARQKLGGLVEYRGAKGQASVFYSIGSGPTISATYVARATFRNGDAEFQLNLTKIDGSWQIDYFHFQSIGPLRPPLEGQS